MIWTVMDNHSFGLKSLSLYSCSHRFCKRHACVLFFFLYDYIDRLYRFTVEVIREINGVIAGMQHVCI